MTSEVCQDTRGGDTYNRQRFHFSLSLSHQPAGSIYSRAVAGLEFLQRLTLIKTLSVKLL